MINDFFDIKLKVLLMGSLINNRILIESLKKGLHTVYTAIKPEDSIRTTETEDIDIVFGTLTYNENVYFDTIQAIKKTHPSITIVLCLKENDQKDFKKILKLQCDQYHYCEDLDSLSFSFIEKVLHKSINEKLSLLRARYFDYLLQNSIVSKTDHDGNITFINDNFIKVTQYMPEEIMGENHRIIRHPITKIEIYKDMWQTITSKNVWRGRVLNKNKDGSDFWADTIIIPFIDEFSGQIIEFTAIRRDITQMLKEKKAIQEKEIKANEKIKIAEAKDAFLILFTHELKTPLNAIINFSQYLYKRMPNIEEIPKTKRIYLLSQIYKSASLMLENVNNILDLGKLHHQKLHYNFTLFNVKETILTVIEQHNALAQEYKRTIRFKNNGSDAFMTSDAYRFKQILSNIISNAIKYGNSLIEISLLSTIQKVEVIIEDDGKGVKNKVEVFDLYMQASSEEIMEKRGTGIGLHFVKLLCEGLKLEYKIEDSSTLGGTKFILTKYLR